MKRTLILLLSLLLCLSALTACAGSGEGTDTSAPTDDATESETISPAEQARLDFLPTVTDHRYELTGDDKPYYFGRWFEKEIDGAPHMVTMTDGAQIYFLVEGAASFDINFTVITTSEEPFFAYIIDGGEPVRQHITEPTVALPDAGIHLVQIVADAMTEGEGKWDKEKGFAVKSILPTGGGQLFGVKPVNRVIFFYGDSITEGIRALNMNATADGNSATNSYTWYCARRLGAVPYFVGYGASGLIQTGSFNTMMNAIDYLSDGRPVSDGVTPDVIVINHGTNDGGHPDKDFEAALRDTLTHLREVYPDAPIVYMIPFGQAKAKVITKVMADVENSYVVETKKWKIKFTDSVHPNAAGAETAGTSLADALVEIFGGEFFE